MQLKWPSHSYKDFYKVVVVVVVVVMVMVVVVVFMHTLQANLKTIVESISSDLRRSLEHWHVNIVQVLK